MKISETWLREWMNPQLTRDELSERLTMAGLEIEGITAVANYFSRVVVAAVLEVVPHPEAKRLRVCRVDVGGAEPLTIVCGAPNVMAGMKTAAALEGAVLPGDIHIQPTPLRGIISHGMLCSARELGLSDEQAGLIVLPNNAPVGQPVWDYLHLADQVMEISITPNRGDCLSVAGLAQDMAALTQTDLTPPHFTAPPVKIADVLPVSLQAAAECPRYVGRIIRNITADAATPIWMQERLRRSGIRHISPVVDVMNYVMLELGQPMHVFDLDKLADEIQVRLSVPNERLELLDGQTITLQPGTLVIADCQKPLAIAGVMGGMESAATLLTQHVFLESAFFQPETIAKMGRHYKLSSESSYRFERGVDPTLQVRALERATELILAIAGGEAGPVIEQIAESFLPQAKQINLRSTRVAQILGITLDNQQIERILQSLGFTLTPNTQGWQVSVPARRFDITLEIDLIEEIGRVHGYEHIPLHQPFASLQIQPRAETDIPLATIRNSLCELGYREVVTYSFVDKKLQNLFDPTSAPKELVNPISAEMAVMRTSLWPGLIETYRYNQNRQQERVRIFESGLRFLSEKDRLTQQPVLAGLISGSALPEQWGMPTRPIDFFDLKGDLEAIFNLTLSKNEIEFKPASHPALHPHQTAEIFRAGEYLGILGILHPAVARDLDINGPIALFEIQLDGLKTAKLPHFVEISKFPEIRRDLAILVQQSIPVTLIQDTITYVAGEWLQSVTVFDVYQGKGIEKDQKSIALALILQHASRTLVDEEVANLMERVIFALKERFAAELRG